MPSFPEGLEPALAARFVEIRQKFLAGLPARLGEIETAQSKEVLEAALHRLAGAAGGYGYAHLHQMARHASQIAHSGEGCMLSATLKQLRQEMERLAN